MKKTKREAKAAGDKFYFTGKPCKHGHMSKRKTNGGGCMECKKTLGVKRTANYNYRRYHSDEEFRRRCIQHVRNWQSKNKEHISEYMKEYYLKNK